MIKRIWAVIKRRRTPLLLLALIIGVAFVTAALWNKSADASDYITAKVDRGTIEVTVSATGTVQAVVTVQVGSQVSGTVSWLGADFNAQVKRGQVVARLDPAIIQAQLETARAALTNSEAAFQVSQTEVSNQKANLAAAKANQQVARVQRDDAIALVTRYKELSSVISGRDIEAAQAQANVAAARYEQAVAQVGQAEAANQATKARLDQARADIARAKAQLAQATANLDHTIITSPIDGVVVSRNVDKGQTVAASLQAPTLFTIANDLTKMQVLASIDEADVGQVKEGITANFNVDAYPGETFSGEISQIRLNAQNLQNVVTYTAVIEVSNPSLKLRPGMTANITVPIAKRENVLTVPNAAFRFKPNLSEKEQQELKEKMDAARTEREERRQGSQPEAAEQAKQSGAPDQGREQGRQRGGRRENQDGQQQQAQDRPGEGRRGGTSSNQPGSSQGESSEGRRQGQMVWVLLEGGKIEPRFVRTGLSNGRISEVVGGNLAEGDVVITGLTEANGRSNRPQQGGAPFGRPGGGMGPRR